MFQKTATSTGESGALLPRRSLLHAPVRASLATALLAGSVWLLPVASFAADDLRQLQQWRRQALELVNQARQENGLDALTLGPDLNEAAQNHAQDMRDRSYYAHASPEGDTVQDRFTDAGGSRWELVAENIARCQDCSPPISSETIKRLQTGWMNSPEHRENILQEGLDRFGYGIVLDAQDGLYGVQTFAGPGAPRGLAANEAPTVLAAEDTAERMAALLNRARQRENTPALKHDEGLDQVAASLLPAPQSKTISLNNDGDLFAALPQDQRTQWRGLSVVAGGCGGCGAQPTEADLRSFRDQWLDNPQYSGQLLSPDHDAFGFALQVNGSGRKVAVLLLATAR